MTNDLSQRAASFDRMDGAAVDLVQWAQVSPIGVGEAPGVDQRGEALVYPGVQRNPARSRPNRGRKKRTDRNPPLPTPPWDLLRGLNIYLPPGLANLPYTPVNWRRGPAWTLWRRQVHQMWGTVCHLCKHAGAHSADHLVPLSVWPNQPYSPYLSRPAHGIEGCPTCGVKCNSSRSNKALALEIGNYKPPVAL